MPRFCKLVRGADVMGGPFGGLDGVSFEGIEIKKPGIPGFFIDYLPIKPQGCLILSGVPVVAALQPERP